MTADNVPWLILATSGMFFIMVMSVIAMRFMRIYEKVQTTKIEHETPETNLSANNPKTNASDNDKPGMESGGYIIFDMPEAKKSVFHDLLKGFEDYARLKGYKITFSVDNTFPNKTAFKFTLDGEGINVSTGQVRKDLKDYLQKVQSGASLDDLPMVLNPEEHSMVLACLQNRISFLEHNLKLQKTGADFYMSLAQQFSRQGLGISQPQNFFIGDGNQTHSLQALNSPQAAVGTGNRLIGNRIDESIHIANSFNERQEQLQALSDLWIKLHAEREKLEKEDPNREKISKAITNIYQAETELKEQDQPEPRRVSRWLENVKATLLTLALTQEVHEAAKKVWELFQMSQ
jgi:hypothetical protein